MHNLDMIMRKCWKPSLGFSKGIQFTKRASGKAIFKVDPDIQLSVLRNSFVSWYSVHMNCLEIQLYNHKPSIFSYLKVKVKAVPSKILPEDITSQRQAQLFWTWYFHSLVHTDSLFLSVRDCLYLMNIQSFHASAQMLLLSGDLPQT